MIRYTTLMKSSLIIGIIGICFAVSHYHCKAYSSPGVEPFSYARDARDVIALFKKDYAWLSTRVFDASYVDWVLKTHSPNEYEPEYQGTMNIDVVREKNQVAGFVTYYLASPIVGRILFLEVGKDFRCKGYGELLVRHAIRHFFKQGISLVQLLTRETNYQAQKLYTRVGFQEISRSEGFIYYAITPQTIMPIQTRKKTTTACPA